MLALAVAIGVSAPIVNGFLQRTLIGEVTPEGPFHQLAETFEAMIREQHWSVLVLLFAALPALCEELVYRGFILSAFGGEKNDRSYPGLGAVVATAALFALFHIYPEKWMGTFFVGLILGTLAVCSRSLWPAIVAHLINNATLVLAGKFGADSLLGRLHDPEASDNAMVVGAATLVLAISVAAVIGLRSRAEDGPARNLTEPPRPRN